MAADILYVDDDSGTGESWLNEGDFDFVAKNPEDVTSDGDISAALQGIKLVLMDYDFHEHERGYSIAHPIDGIELLERFRAVRRHDKNLTEPLLTIYTGRTDELTREFKSPSSVPYFLAPKTRGADWLFEKGVDREKNSRRLKIMLSEFDAESEESEESEETEETDTAPEQRLYNLLSLPKDERWTRLGKEQVIDLVPPISSMLEDNRRVELMRWLLHKSLPLPTFPGCFVDLNWVSARLGVDTKVLRNTIRENPESGLAQNLETCKYKGLLAGFFEDRYWKAGVDELIWELTGGLPTLNESVKEKIISEVGSNVSFSERRRPVFLIDPSTYEPTEKTCEMDEAVQVRPEFWPDGIESPWVRLEDVRHDEKLKSIVINEDRGRLQGAETL